MVWPAIIAGAAALGGSLMNSISGHNDKKADRHLANQQFNAQMDETVQRRVKDALKAGINPLAALGYNGGASPTIHAGGSGYSTSSLGDGIAQVGAIFGNYLQRKQDAADLRDKQADDLAYDTKMKDLNLEEQQLRNRYLSMQIASMKKPGEDIEPSMQGESLLFQPVYDMQGRPRLVVNQNALEADSDNPGYMSSITATIADGIAKGQIDPISGEIKSRQLRMMIDDYYYQTTGHHIQNLESLYISPTEAAMAATMLARGVS